MATKTLSQLHRLAFVRISGGTKSVFTLEPADLGQDAYITFNVSPRKQSRASAVGTSETPISGTFDALSGSISFLADNWKVFGEALGNFTAATYTGAGNDGQVIFGGADDLCAGGEYLSVIAQGICDDGSASDVEFTRCMPSVDGDVELGGSDTATVTLALNPIIYNASEHSGDGFPAYTARLGVQNTTKKTRFNPTTGGYDDVTES